MSRSQFSEDLKVAMKSGDKLKVSVVRLILSSIKDKDIDERSKGNTQGISDDQIMQLLQSMIKQRRESILLYEQGNRPELAALENDEIGVIQTYLPEQMTLDQVKKAIQEIVRQVGAKTLKDTGLVMKELKQKFSGQMDFSQVSNILKDTLI